MVEKQDVEEPTEDPLVLYRHMLHTGVGVKVWTKGAASPLLLFVASEWNAVFLKDSSKRVNRGERYLLRSLDKVEKGYGSGHKKKTGIGAGHKVDEDLCLRVVNRPRAGEVAFDVLSLSFKSVEERDLWFDALSRLIQTSKLWSHRLKTG